jgi:hypothetical protein
MEDFARNAGGEMPDFGKGYGWLKNEKKLTDIGFYCLAFRDIEISYWTVMDIGWFADIGSFYQSTS